MSHNVLIKTLIKNKRNFSINSSHTIVYLDASHITMTTCHCYSAFTGNAASALWSVAFSPI